MKIHKKINKKSMNLNTTEAFVGESLETKVRRQTQSKEPIEAISPMLYTERKDGVRPEYNIRTDKWEIAQQAMTTIAEGKRQKRVERLTDKPAGSSEKNAQSTNNE